MGKKTWSSNSSGGLRDRAGDLKAGQILGIDQVLATLFGRAKGTALDSAPNRTLVEAEPCGSLARIQEPGKLNDPADVRCPVFFFFHA